MVCNRFLLFMQKYTETFSRPSAKKEGIDFHSSVRSKKKFDFAIHSGATGSIYTGGNIDHTSLSHRGSYLYAEAARNEATDMFLVRTPTVDMTKGTKGFVS